MSFHFTVNVRVNAPDGVNASPRIFLFVMFSFFSNDRDFRNSRNTPIGVCPDVYGNQLLITQPHLVFQTIGQVELLFSGMHELEAGHMGGGDEAVGGTSSQPAAGTCTAPPQASLQNKHTNTIQGPRGT